MSISHEKRLKHRRSQTAPVLGHNAFHEGEPVLRRLSHLTSNPARATIRSHLLSDSVAETAPRLASSLRADVNAVTSAERACHHAK